MIILMFLPYTCFIFHLFYRFTLCFKYHQWRKAVQSIGSNWSKEISKEYTMFFALRVVCLFLINSFTKAPLMMLSSILFKLPKIYLVEFNCKHKEVFLKSLRKVVNETFNYNGLFYFIFSGKSYFYEAILNHWLSMQGCARLLPQALWLIRSITDTGM